MSDPAAPHAGRRGLYRRFFAWMLSRSGDVGDERGRAFRERALSQLEGTVVEIGAGAGANLRYLGSEVRLVAVEPNLHNHPYLRAEAEARGRSVEVRTGTAEALPVEDHGADAVVSSLVLCSVQDVEGVLREVLRVLRPGGRFVFLEHVGAEPGTALRRWQERVRPVWRWLGDGCEPDRDLEEAIRGAGFARVELERYSADVPIPLVRPHIAGVAHAPEAAETTAAPPA